MRRETRMVFMFAGRVNMRASPRTGGAFFQRSVYTPASTGADGNGGGRESRMNGKKVGGRGDAATFEFARQPTHFADCRERTRNTGNTTREDTTPRDAHVVDRFFRVKSCVLLSRDCPKWSTAPHKQCVGVPRLDF